MTIFNTSQPHIVVVGAGALGSLIGGMLAEGGLPVTLVARRPEHPDAIARQGGLRIAGHGGDRIVTVRATGNALTVDHADIVIFLCKTVSTREAAQSAVHLFRDGRTIAVSFQNGLGNEEEIAAVIGADRVIAGLTALGARLEEPGLVRSFAQLPSYLGGLSSYISPKARAVAELFTRHGLPTEYTPDIRRKKWVKLCANVAFSATSGATGLTIAEVARVPELRSSALRAIDETAAVAAACAIEIGTEERREIFDALTDPNGAGANTASMYRDLAAGRATEVDSIYGTVIRLAERHLIPTPTLETLAAIVKGLEAANAPVQETGTPLST